MILEGRTVTVVGLAKSGQAAARLALRQGAVVRVMDVRRENTFDPDLLAWFRKERVRAEFGPHSGALIRGSDWVVLSPGVPFDAAPAQAARDQGIPVIGELEFAFTVCPCPVVAVTGSNGKTTVTTLIGRVLSASGRKVFVGGNIGSPLSGQVLSLAPDDIAVLEVSSFQLETAVSFRPKAAVFLNMSRNHLDRHRDMDEYFQAKKRMFQNQGTEDIAVLNAADPLVASVAPELRSRIIWFNTPEQKSLTGWDNPNFLAVSAVVSAFQIDASFCGNVFQDFRGIEHRFEIVREKDGVTYINDSKATTVESGLWALTRLENPVVWICGGRDKGLDFTPLREVLQPKVKRMIVIGETAEKLRAMFSDRVPVECCGDLRQAVQVASQSADSGETVLFSPMCASFDMFENFEHRGREFKRIVGEL